MWKVGLYIIMLIKWTNFFMKYYYIITNNTYNKRSNMLHNYLCFCVKLSYRSWKSRLKLPFTKFLSTKNLSQLFQNWYIFSSFTCLIMTIVSPNNKFLLNEIIPLGVSLDCLYFIFLKYLLFWSNLFKLLPANLKNVSYFARNNVMLTN